jgi:hypothetical protein
MKITPPERSVTSADPDRWRDKHGLAEHFSCGIRWIEARMSEGMPHTYIAGRAKFKVAKVESWLDDHGFIERRGVSCVEDANASSLVSEFGRWTAENAERVLGDA